MYGESFAIRILNVEQVLWYWRCDGLDFRLLFQPLSTLASHSRHIQGVAELAVLLTTARIGEPESVVGDGFLRYLQNREQQP